jgi:hypothetical protein
MSFVNIDALFKDTNDILYACSILPSDFNEMQCIKSPDNSTE